MTVSKMGFLIFEVSERRLSTSGRPADQRTQELSLCKLEVQKILKSYVKETRVKYCLFGLIVRPKFKFLTNILVKLNNNFVSCFDFLHFRF